MAIADTISESTTTSPPMPADLLVMVAAMLPEDLESLLENLSSIFPAETALIATENPAPEHVNSSFRVVSVPSTNSRSNLTSADFLRAWQLVQQHQTRAVLILGPGAESLAPAGLSQLANAVLAESVDLALPRYSLPPHAGLANSAIFYPLSRALFSTRVRFPLTTDLAFSSRMAQRLAVIAQKSATGDAAEAPLWPASEAAVAGFGIDEFEVGQRAFPQPSDADINALLTRVIGSLFSDIEAKAAYWQRVRRVPPPRRLNGVKPMTDGTTDLPRMVESFRFAYNNLFEIWSLVLPPHSLLGLKRLTSLSVADFSMPDTLWVRIVFDFLIAYRQRTINRGHLLGALIPLYLAWVAGHINLTAAGTDPESHVEALANAFETDKPYLVSRWRWPDRFNS
jgi:glucosylglycerate synthase